MIPSTPWLRAVWCWLLLPVVAAGMAPGTPAHAEERAAMKLDIRFPAQHPYVTLTPAEIARAKERAGRFAWARQTLKNLEGEANGIAAAPWGKLPERGDNAHRSLCDRLFTVALAYAFTGERRYAEWVRAGLVAYADLYPTLPLTNHRCRLLPASSLYEATWLVPIAQAYDLTADSGAFTPEQRRHVENDLLRLAAACFKIDDFAGDPRIRDLHFRCYNFQAWHLSAVGLVGLAVKDPALVDYAVNSPYGLRHLIAHDIRDDGLFWERSAGYHHFVVSALLPFTEAMARAGVGLYPMEVPNDRSKDEDAHYVTDTSDKPKSLRLLFEAPFYLAFPDLSYIALGDSDHGPLRGDWMTLVAYHRTHDPRLAWLLQRDTPVETESEAAGRVGFLHYYRYRYRYEDVRLNGKPAEWDRRDATYELQGASVAAEDGGDSQQDHYLLARPDLADFTLEWMMTRLADGGSQDRAWVVYHVDPHNDGNRESFALHSLLPEVGRSYAFRLVVAGGEAKLFRDGEAIPARPTVYHYGPDWHWLIYDAPGSAAVPAGGIWADGGWANTGVFRNGCSLFPSSGVAVLRQSGADFTKEPNSAAVAFSYGPYGGGHGHPDKLSFAFYAGGRQWIPHFGSMPYETHWKAEWTAHTLSHNTVVIDGVSQKPTEERNPMWPVDSAADRVVGVLERFEPERKAVSAWCDSAYPGMRLRRALRLADGCLVDSLTVTPSQAEGAGQHQVDYVLHVDGTLAETAVALVPRPEPLGTKCGYQYVEGARSAVLAKPAAFTFTAGEKRLRIWVVPAPGAPVEAILAEGLTKTPGQHLPMLLLRTHGTSARFLTVLEPSDAPVPLRGVRLDAGTLVLERPGGDTRVTVE